MLRLLLSIIVVISLGGCQTVYFDAMEKMGIAKRDILVDRVEDARDAQTEVQEQFNSALEELTVLINFDGGDIQGAYDALSDQYEASKSAADNVSNRIGKIESVADALFEEWQEEIEQYNNANFKRNSQKQLRDTQNSYAKLLRSMRRAESKMSPVLSSLKDNVLYLKHNLNARAISAISIEFKGLKQEIQSLINEVNKSITESNQFIAAMDNK
ncbi:MAG: DUF2959 domain-containing protein [Gammaproteobacteria bacterium]|nr:DUF2959 domain-containing protein [Gammaproteobacteria bacterium]